MSHVKGSKVVSKFSNLTPKLGKWLGQNSHVSQGSHRNKGYKTFNNKVIKVIK